MNAMSLTQVSKPEGAIECLDDGIGFVALVDRMRTDHAAKVVNSARISYEKVREGFDESKDRALCSFLWKHGHTSPYRHSFYTFHWKSPLFVFRQAFKYQVGSGWREFYVPVRMRANPPHGNKQASFDLPEDFDHAGERATMIAECEQAFALYQERIERGVAKEIARMCLPQNLYTQAYWTVSMQGVIHFLEQRLSPAAQYEIRRHAEAVYDLIADDLERIGVTKADLVGA